MIDGWLKMWNGKKWLFFLLLIPMGVILIMKILSGNNISGAVEDVNNAQEKDDELADKQNELNDKANDAKAKADQHADKIDKIESDDDVDWHKKV